MDKLEQKYMDLKNRIASEGKAAVAFSGGVDSVFLLYAAREALGERVLALTMSLHAVPRKELLAAEAFCREHHIRHQVERIDEFGIEGFAANPPDRCYLCKRALFQKMQAASQKAGFPVLMEGSNVDDLKDYRPGLRALEELKIRSPLREAGFSKAEIREMSKRLGLPAWNKPSMACLASRFVCGETITEEKLKMVEKAEEYLDTLGFVQRRVRIHGRMARMELLPEDIERLFENRLYQDVEKKLSELGFSHVALDLKGFRSGSMNPAACTDRKET